MNVSAVRHGPALAGTDVYRPTIGPQFAPRLHLLEQEVHHVRLVREAVVHDGVCKLAGAFLLGHDEGGFLEVRLVHLHNTLENMLFLGQMFAEGGVPAPDRALGQVRELLRLQDRFSNRPAPQECPPDLKRELQIREPGM